MKNIKLFLTDVDGCLTDGGMYYGETGEEMKRFCVYDGMGMVLLRKAGIPCGIITSETSVIVKKRAERLKLDYLFMGVGRQLDDMKQTKLEVCQQLCQELGISMQEVCYVGDDVNDLDILAAVGYPACPVNARPQVKAIPGMMVLEQEGGHGAVRELCDRILAAKEQNTEHYF